MKFNLTINEYEKTKILVNKNNFNIKEVQKNRLNKDTIENKIVLVFNTLKEYQDYGSPLISSNISYLQISTENGDIIFEKDNIAPENISLFSNIGENEITLDIVVFESL